MAILLVCPLSRLLAVGLLCVCLGSESMFIYRSQVLITQVLESSLVVTCFHDNRTSLSLRGYLFARFFFLSMKLICTNIMFCHQGEKQTNKTCVILWPIFSVPLMLSYFPSLNNDVWMGLSKCVSCTRFLSTCFTALYPLAVKLRLICGVSCLFFKVLLGHVTTEKCDVCCLFGYVSFSNTEPFERHCIAVTRKNRFISKAELGTSSDLTVVTLSLL